MLLHRIENHLLVLLCCGLACFAYAQDEEINIEGTALMLDDKTPHVALVVQAVLPGPLSPQIWGEKGGRRGAGGEGEPTVVATTLTGENGKYQFVNLLPGRYQVRCYTTKGYVYYRPKSARLGDEGPNEAAVSVLQVKRGRTLKNIDFRIAPFKKGTWRTYNALNGLGHTWVNGIGQLADGRMWFREFAEFYRSVTLYDGDEFVPFPFAEFGDEAAKDGGPIPRVNDIYQSADGSVWVTTMDGVSRYDGKERVNFTTADGLADNRVWTIYQAPDGVLWFGTDGGGVSRYDGERFSNFTTADGLANNRVWTIYRTPDGVISTWTKLLPYFSTTYSLSF